MAPIVLDAFSLSRSLQKGSVSVRLGLSQTQCARLGTKDKPINQPQLLGR